MRNVADNVSVLNLEFGVSTDALFFVLMLQRNDIYTSFKVCLRDSFVVLKIQV